MGKRLAQHVRSGKFSPEDAKAAKVLRVPGGKTQRELAEQKWKIGKGGVKREGGQLLNQRNAVSDLRYQQLGLKK